jgi:hypothetical protein
MHTKIALQVAIGAIMFFGFGILSVQGQALTNTFSFQSDFETLATPLCGIGEKRSFSVVRRILNSMRHFLQVAQFTRVL